MGCGPTLQDTALLFDEAFVTVLMLPERRLTLMMTEEFLRRPDFFERIRRVLPDFLSQQSNRIPQPRARWKDMWATEASSMLVVEQRVASLIEQALWAMMDDDSLLAEPVAVEIPTDNDV